MVARGVVSLLALVAPLPCGSGSDCPPVALSRPQGRPPQLRSKDADNAFNEGFNQGSANPARALMQGGGDGNFPAGKTLTWTPFYSSSGGSRPRQAATLGCRPAPAATWRLGVTVLWYCHYRMGCPLPCALQQPTHPLHHTTSHQLLLLLLLPQAGPCLAASPFPAAQHTPNWP